MKYMKQVLAVAPLLLFVILTTGCSPEGGSRQPAANAGAEPAVAVVEEQARESEAVSALTGTSWRLVQIMGMDDSVAEPEDRSLYTLEFNADGQAAVRADCNRGMGSWTSESAGQLQFGPIATTRAMCPPGSISDKYLAQFEWVRSYVMKDGHLFLATMADGAIIEFEPAPTTPPDAVVLGEEVRTTDADEMQQVIITRLFDQYAAERGIEAADEEIEAFVQNMRRGMAAQGMLDAENDLTAEELVQVETMRRDIARSIIRQWKLNRALYGQYGGRIIYQQLGPEPLDAYRVFLEERQQSGDFRIEDSAFEEEFWRYFTDESKHDFMAPGSADENRAFAIPPWEQTDESS